MAVDTSVAVPLLVGPHPDHASVLRWWSGREIRLSGHALAETYSVLTRLPGDLRLEAADAARAIRRAFAPPLQVRTATMRRLPQILSDLGVSGSAVYDALVALAAAEAGRALATRDARALATYRRVGVDVEIVS